MDYYPVSTSDLLYIKKFFNQEFYTKHSNSEYEESNFIIDIKTSVKKNKKISIVIEK